MLYKEYSRRGVLFLHCFSGETTLTSMDFQKHYRSRFPHAIDPVRAVEKKYNPDGWPFYLILNRKGDVVYRENALVGRDEDKIRAVLDHVALDKPVRVMEYGGTQYAQKTAKRNKTSKKTTELFPCLVADGKGDLYLSYVRHEKGTNSVVVRLMRGGEGTREITASKGLTDPYHAVMTADRRNTVWIFLTALADSGKYDVFARHLAAGGKLSKSVNLTLSGDDAMHPDAAVDEAGNVWVAYYRWRKIGLSSRDKEVFARYFDGESWSAEMQLSPRDVPDYEDHTDPSVARTAGGGVCVAWSWDMHPLQGDAYQKYRRYQTRYRADGPTIFGSGASAEEGVGDLYFFGETSIDNAPELCLTSDGKLWCAWSTLGSGGRKALYTSYCAEGKYDRSEQFIVEDSVLDICSPCFAEVGSTCAILWCSREHDGPWSLKRSVFNNGRWSTPEVIDKEGSPRFATAVSAGDGRVWVAYSKESGHGRRIAVKKLSF